MIHVVKIGGAVIDEPGLLDRFLAQFAALEGVKILVHGGGRSASEMSKVLGLEPKMVDGRRITDDATIKVVTMMYGGLINRQMVASLQALGLHAIGVSGADANILPAVKRPVQTIDYGWVGDIHFENLKAGPLKALLDVGLTPVVCPITHDGQGHLLNTNADTVAAAIAVQAASLAETCLWFAFEKEGVLADVEDEQSVIASLSLAEAQALMQKGKIHSGMRPKIQAAEQAIKHGVSQVSICRFDQVAALCAGDDLRYTKITL